MTSAIKRPPLAWHKQILGRSTHYAPSLLIFSNEWQQFSSLGSILFCLTCRLRWG